MPQKPEPKLPSPIEKVVVESVADSVKSTLGQNRIRCGADRTERYFSMLAGKRIGLVVNPTSRIGTVPLADTLLSAGFQVKRIFGPEHGFRGKVGAGIKVANEVDSISGISVISLYGKKLKPQPDQLADLDILVFDIQDVGARFYTYNQTLHYVMEACAEAGKPVLILDRPNPNGMCIDGPILETELKSFIGMHPIPICHGMTVGEFAQMLNGEKWLKNGITCSLDVIRVENYAHDSIYQLPVSPSPNLNTPLSISLYSSLCLFEGTRISLGRGTHFPFTVLGAPTLAGKFEFSFKPEVIKGMAETPLYKNQTCFGLDLRTLDWKVESKRETINLKWLMDLYAAFPERNLFFDKSLSSQINDFDKLAGTRNLRKQIEAGLSESEIRKSWEPGLGQFKEMRKKYLLYP